jgi:hypothetical protein
MTDPLGLILEILLVIDVGCDMCIKDNLFYKFYQKFQNKSIWFVLSLVKFAYKYCSIFPKYLPSRDTECHTDSAMYDKVTDTIFECL